MFQLLSLLMFFLLIPSDVFGHSVRNRVSTYQDDQGSSRQRVKLDADFELKHQSSLVNQSNVSLSASKEQFIKDDISEDEYMQKYYGERRVTDSLTLVSAQVWDRLTDSRVLAGYSGDGVMRSRTGAVGFGQWFWHENLQLALDISRTIVEQPVFETLGADSDIVAPPALVTSTGTSLSSKYLATPVTILNLAYTHVEKNDRPPANIYLAGIKQYIRPSKSAVHAEIARAFNHGRVTTESSFGEVNAWIAELAFLQSLWRGGNSKISYRYYREDETTRVGGEKYVRGSDLFTLFFAQEISKNIVDSLKYPLVVETSASRYKTNELEEGEAVAANMYEVGLLAKF